MGLHLSGPEQNKVLNPPGFHLLLNLAVGGTFGGPPDARTRFPAAMEIDWVRVWQ